MFEFWPLDCVGAEELWAVAVARTAVRECDSFYTRQRSRSLWKPGEASQCEQQLIKVGESKATTIRVMFGEDRDDDDAAAARAHDFWPPAGFRDRLKNSAFHHHPKSSDQVIQQLRDELDKQRQMFFDRVAVPSSHWESASQSPHSATMRVLFY